MRPLAAPPCNARKGARLAPPHPTYRPTILGGCVREGTRPLPEPAEASASDVERSTGRRVDELRPGDHVVIIGAGPAGLTAAYLLATEGTHVTVLEADDVV